MRLGSPPVSSPDVSSPPHSGQGGVPFSNGWGLVLYMQINCLFGASAAFCDEWG